MKNVNHRLMHASEHWYLHGDHCPFINPDQFTDPRIHLYSLQFLLLYVENWKTEQKQVVWARQSPEVHSNPNCSVNFSVT